MIAQEALHPDLESASPTSRAAHQLWAEIERARSNRDHAEALVKRLVGTLEVLLDALPVAEQEEYRRRLAHVGVDGSLSDGRGGKEVYHNVIELFKRSGGKELTVPEIQTALSKDGDEINPKLAKAIYNSLNYFAKKGLLKRVSWGQYVFRETSAGVGDFLDDAVPDDGTIRRSENDD
jgi:hypothetical protein